MSAIGSITRAIGGIGGSLGSTMDFVRQMRDRRKQRIQDSFLIRGRKAKKLARRLARQRGTLGTLSQPTSELSGMMPGAQVSGGLIGAASSAAAAQEPVEPEALAPADTQGAFDANIGLIRTADPSMMFGANRAKINAMNDLGRDPYNAFDDYRTVDQKTTAAQAEINNDLRYGRSGRLMGSSIDEAIMRSGRNLGYDPRQRIQQREFDYGKLGYEMSSNANLANLFAGRTALYFKKQKTK